MKTRPEHAGTDLGVLSGELNSAGTYSLDLTRATLPLPYHADRELLFRMLESTNAGDVEELTRLAQAAVDRR